MITGFITFVGLLALASASPFYPSSCSNPHEVYTSCGRTCTPTCNNPYPSNCDSSSCEGGCSCEPGYVLNEVIGSCVLVSECSSKYQRCGPNEIFKKCKRTCEPTCKYQKPKECSIPCLDYGCQCRKGFVRDRDGDCVPYDLCPNKRNVCGKNEVYSNETYVPETVCQEPRCDNQRYRTDCPAYFTNGGCVCKSGYVRTNKGKCVQQKDCHDSSESDESYDSDDSHDSDESDDSDDSDSDEDCDSKPCKYRLPCYGSNCYGK